MEEQEQYTGPSLEDSMRGDNWLEIHMNILEVAAIRYMASLSVSKPTFEKKSFFNPLINSNLKNTTLFLNLKKITRSLPLFLHKDLPFWILAMATT